jgi:hypothetical protein
MPVIQENDVELLIQGDVPTFIIEVYVPGDQKYELALDKEQVTSLRQQLEQSYGVAKIGDIMVRLKNPDHRYTNNHAASIFFGSRVAKDPIRIRYGWGPTYGNEIATQFQGRIRDLATIETRKATLRAYDAMKDILDTTVSDTDGLRIYEDLAGLASMQVIDVLEYLVTTKYGLTRFNMDTLIDEDLLDADALTLARNASIHILVNDTTWPEGTRLTEMLQDLMKLCNGYLYTAKDGKLNVRVYQPSQELDATYTFYGDENADITRQILQSRRTIDESKIYNKVNWKYGQAGNTYSSPPDEASQALYDEKSLNLTTKWEVDTSILDNAAIQIMARYSGVNSDGDPAEVGRYKTTLSWLMDGQALKLNLGDWMILSDPAHNIETEYVEVQTIIADPDNQKTEIESEDVTALQGKFGFFSSEIDEGDGLGITANQFALWVQRFGFFSDDDNQANPGFDADGNVNGVINPDFGTQDDWGNGIEEHFVFW